MSKYTLMFKNKVVLGNYDFSFNQDLTFKYLEFFPKNPKNVRISSCF